MQLDNVLWQVEEGVGVATINRPKALNALDGRTVAELSRLLDEVAADRTLRGLVLTGAGGKAFAAGADLAEMARLAPPEARRFAAAGQQALAKLEALPIPTIAAVNGFAFGGGCELAMACDLIYASEQARFGQPEVNLALIPGFGGTQRLVRRVGIMRAKEMILTGDAVDAARARALGLVLEVLPDEKLVPFAVAQARKIASRGPLAVAAAKRVIEAGAEVDRATGCALELEAFALIFTTDDAREGMAAFLAKRPASFKGA
jgi:enoyl-CoA hydratase